MKKRYFTVKKANAMLPQVKQKLTRIRQMRVQSRMISQLLQEAGCLQDEEAFDIPSEQLGLDVLDEVTSLKLLLDEINKEILTLTELGVIIKDIDKGLIDWYAKKDDREIFLCWMFGDKAVMYWHELKAGFKGRKPISEL